MFSAVRHFGWKFQAPFNEVKKKHPKTAFRTAKYQIKPKFKLFSCINVCSFYGIPTWIIFYILEVVNHIFSH